MSDNLLVILLTFCIVALLLTFVGCVLDTGGDDIAHHECLRQGIPSDSNYTYMRGINTGDVVCVIKVEVPIQMEEQDDY